MNGRRRRRGIKREREWSDSELYCSEEFDEDIIPESEDEGSETAVYTDSDETIPMTPGAYEEDEEFFD